MIEKLDSEYKEDSYDASDDENYIPAANGGTALQKIQTSSKKKNTTPMKVFRMSLCLKTSAVFG